MANWCTLTFNSAYLKNVDSKTTEAGGITAANLTAAAADATNEVRSALAGAFDTTGADGTYTSWDTTTPGIVEQVTEMVAASIVLEYLYQVNDVAVGRGAKASMAVVLRERAELMLRRILGEVKPRLHVVLADGTLQHARKYRGPAVGVVRGPDVTFFPAKDTDKSHSRTTAQNLETTFKENVIPARTDD